MMNENFTKGPWHWQGEDYRGGWGLQLLVGPNGEGIACGESADGIYKGLKAHQPIASELCKTGFGADENSAPCLHVRQADAQLIKAAPDLYEALKSIMTNAGPQVCSEGQRKTALKALAKARGEI